MAAADSLCVCWAHGAPSLPRAGRGVLRLLGSAEGMGVGTWWAPELWMAGVQVQVGWAKKRHRCQEQARGAREPLAELPSLHNTALSLLPLLTNLDPND